MKATVSRPTALDHPARDICGDSAAANLGEESPRVQFRSKCRTPRDWSGS